MLVLLLALRTGSARHAENSTEAGRMVDVIAIVPSLTVGATAGSVSEAGGYAEEANYT